MIDQQVSSGRDVVPTPDPGRTDHSMDALQYAIAFVAIVVAALLASAR
jgi:hypothetical protein